MLPLRSGHSLASVGTTQTPLETSLSGIWRSNMRSSLLRICARNRWHYGQELVGALDGILQAQAATDAAYFEATCRRALSTAEADAVQAGILNAYRWQHLISGAQHPHFVNVLNSLITASQGQRIASALAPLS
jgi:hypothetical protein